MVVRRSDCWYHTPDHSSQLPTLSPLTHDSRGVDEVSEEIVKLVEAKTVEVTTPKCRLPAPIVSLKSPSCVQRT